MLLSIIILNYQTPELVVSCLSSVLPEINGISAQITVVDNYSSDNSVEFIRNWIEKQNATPQITLLESPINSGFSGGNNIGIQNERAEYYLMLNSDTLVHSGSIESLLEAIRLHPEAAIIGPKMVGVEGEIQQSCFRYHNPFSQFTQVANTGFLDRVFGAYQVSFGNPDSMIDVDWVTFACVLIRGEALDSIGLLDDGYFMYFEDAEYCMRANKSGWKVLYYPFSTVCHIRGASSNIRERRKTHLRLPKFYYQSRTRFFYQAYGYPGLFAANLAWILGRIISKSRQLLGRRDKAVPANAWIDIWTNFLKPLRKPSQPKTAHN